MRHTLDTNIFLYGAIRDSLCEIALREYTKSQESFITRKVYEELARKRGLWNLTLKMISNKFDSNKSIAEVYTEIKQSIGDSDGEMINCQNLIDYLDKQKEEGKLDFGYEISRMNSFLGGYLTNKKPIHPSNDMYNKFKAEEAEIKKVINGHNLVDGEQDKAIIREIFIITKFFSETVTLITKNVKDFHTDKAEWKSELSQIIVVHPSSIY